MFRFSLVKEAWIPVIRDGQPATLSLLEAFRQAHLIDRIEDASPLVVGALHRLLLAILYRAVAPTECSFTTDEVAEIYKNPQGKHQTAIADYLAHWECRFDLFSPTRPFYQTVGIDAKTKTVSQLSAELSSGSNKLLFDHTFDEQTLALEPGEAARLLIARQMLAIPEGSGYSPSPIGGTALVLAMGRNLHETLCLNLIPYDEKDFKADHPVWESERDRPLAEQPIRGLTHRYTWMSRLIRLVPEEQAGTTRVRFVQYGPATKLVAEGEGSSFNPDPMVAYRLTEKNEYRALAFRTDRAFWRDFAVLVPQKAKGSYTPPLVVEMAFSLLNELQQLTALRTMVLGATNDKAKFELWRTEYHQLPQAISSNRKEDAYAQLSQSLQVAEELGKKLSGAARVLAQHLLSHGQRNPDKADITRLVNSFPTYSTYWSELEQAFPWLVDQLTDQFEAKKVQAGWFDRLIKASDHAWQLTRLAAGDDAFALRAIYRAEGILRAAQKKLCPTTEETKEAS